MANNEEVCVLQAPMQRELWWDSRAFPATGAANAISGVQKEQLRNLGQPIWRQRWNTRGVHVVFFFEPKSPEFRSWTARKIRRLSLFFYHQKIKIRSKHYPEGPRPVICRSTALWHDASWPLPWGGDGPIAGYSKSEIWTDGAMLHPGHFLDSFNHFIMQLPLHIITIYIQENRV